MSDVSRPPSGGTAPYSTSTPCQCCGAAPATVHYGEADSHGHAWQHSVCQDCYDDCSSDEEGRPVHLDVPTATAPTCPT